MGACAYIVIKIAYGIPVRVFHCMSTDLTVLSSFINMILSTFMCKVIYIYVHVRSCIPYSGKFLRGIKFRVFRK